MGLISFSQSIYGPQREYRCLILPQLYTITQKGVVPNPLKCFSFMCSSLWGISAPWTALIEQHEKFNYHIHADTHTHIWRSKFSLEIV